MRHLNGVYTQYINRTHRRVGHLSGDYSMKAVAEYLGVHYSTVSRAVAEYESEAQ